MNNKKLSYMIKNDPEKTLSLKEFKIRNYIRPTIHKILKLSNKLNLIVDKKEFTGSERKVIYVASHGFKDDVLNTVLTIKDDIYIVFGNIDLFFNTLDGLFLWLYGVQLVDRYNKESRNAMKNKMDRVLKLGNNLLIFSEATWNLSPNKLMEKLHWGLYDVALKNNALIVPVVTNKVGNKCYAQMLKEIEITKITKEDKENIYQMMLKYIRKAIEICNNKNIKKYIDYLYKIIINNKLDIDKIEQEAIAIEKILEQKKYSTEDEIKQNKIEIIKTLISRIATSKKEYKVICIRDIMATSKYELIEKYPDYSYMKNGKDKYEAWNDYIKETIKATPYFYPEQEKTTLFKDKLIAEPEEVFTLKNIRVCN